jgi:hypothetical protein
MRQVQVSRYRQANSKLRINIDVHDRADAPSVQFSFVDGSKYLFDNAATTKVDEMLFNIHLQTMNLDATYEMAGKNIEEEE